MGLFLAEGERTVKQIVQNGQLDIEAMIVGESRLTEGTLAQWPTLVSSKLFSASAEQIAQLSDTETPQEIVCICRIPKSASLEDLARPLPSQTSNHLPVILALDAIQDPGNLGTILRSAAWFGVQGLFIGKGTVDLWNPKVIRSAVGGIAGTAIAEGNLQEALVRLKELGCRVCTLELGEGAISLSHFSQTQMWEGEIKEVNPWIVVVGNEANGVSEGVSALSDVCVRIEGGAKDSVESLNAGVSVGIALYAIYEAALSKRKV